MNEWTMKKPRCVITKMVRPKKSQSVLRNGYTPARHTAVFRVVGFSVKNASTCIFVCWTNSSTLLLKLTSIFNRKQLIAGAVLGMAFLHFLRFTTIIFHHFPYFPSQENFLWFLYYPKSCYIKSHHFPNFPSLENFPIFQCNSRMVISTWPKLQLSLQH